jgi:hypothetical protein
MSRTAYQDSGEDSYVGEEKHLGTNLNNRYGRISQVRLWLVTWAWAASGSPAGPGVGGPPWLASVLA